MLEGIYVGYVLMLFINVDPWHALIFGIGVDCLVLYSYFMETQIIDNSAP